MKLLHLAPSIHREASGISYSVRSLTRSLAVPENDVSLFCLPPGASVEGVHLELFPEIPFAKRFSLMPGFPRRLRNECREAGIVHCHGLWSFLNLTSGWIVPNSERRLVVSPHGMLAPSALRHSQLAKNVMWPLQKKVLNRASLIHSTSFLESEDIRRAKISTPIATLPNGIDVPPLSKRKPRKHRRLLSLGRLHPIKGIETLLRAWARVEAQHEDWTLEIVGGGEPVYEAKLRSLARDLQLRRVEFSGPAYGETKLEKYRQADLFVLPSHSENFGLVVAEALAAGRPAIVSRGAPWDGLQQYDCGWWVHDSVDSFVDAFRDALILSPEELFEKGERGRAWMARDYAWSQIAEQMAEVYEWLLHGAPPPSCVTRG